MSAAARELFRDTARSLRRTTLWWAVGVVFFCMLNAAFWPTFSHSDALQGLEDMGDLMDAFGAGDLASPAGYLDGQVFALMLPLLLSAMAIAVVSSVSSGDEGTGRLELLHALPVSRRTVWFSRCGAAVAGVVAVSTIVAAAMVVSIRAFDFDGVGAAAVVASTAACALLALYHGAVAFAAGGAGWTRGRAVGTSVVVMVAGYLVAVVLPLSDTFRRFRSWSPWYWALGEQPTVDGVHPLRWLLLVALSAALVAVGAVLLDRRDLRSA